MNTLIHADIFFFISSIGFVILFVLLFIALFYLIKLFRNVERISKKVEGSIDTVGDDAKEFIADMRESVLFRFLVGRRKHAHRKKE